MTLRSRDYWEGKEDALIHFIRIAGNTEGAEIWRALFSEGLENVHRRMTESGPESGSDSVVASCGILEGNGKRCGRQVIAIVMVRVKLEGGRGIQTAVFACARHWKEKFIGAEMISYEPIESCPVQPEYFEELQQALEKIREKDEVIEGLRERVVEVERNNSR